MTLIFSVTCKEVFKALWMKQWGTGEEVCYSRQIIQLLRNIVKKQSKTGSFIGKGIFYVPIFTLFKILLIMIKVTIWFIWDSVQKRKKYCVSNLLLRRIFMVDQDYFSWIQLLESLACFLDKSPCYAQHFWRHQKPFNYYTDIWAIK